MVTQELSLDPTERAHLADILSSEKTLLIRVWGRGLWVCSVCGREWNGLFVTQSPDCGR